MWALIAHDNIFRGEFVKLREFKTKEEAEKARKEMGNPELWEITIEEIPLPRL